MTRYILSYVDAGGARYICQNTFSATPDGLQIARYYSAPRLGEGGKFEGWRAEYAPVEFDESKQPDAQTLVGEWVELGQ